MFALLSIILLFLGIVLGADPTAIWILAASQLFLLVHYILRGQVSAVGAFIFMSFLFFGVRAIYIVTEDDYRLFTGLFRIPGNIEILHRAVWWGTAAMFCFHLGAEAARIRHTGYFNLRQVFSSKLEFDSQATDRMVWFLLAYQSLSLLFMHFLSGAGRILYSSPIGAYVYDLPMLLQAGHVFALVVILERWLKLRDIGRLVLLVASGVLFLLITWEMREITLFRGFYVTGVMVAGIAMLTRLKPRVSYFWLIVPILLAQPLFRTLGETRKLSNEGLDHMTIEERVLDEQTLVEAYWSFYDSSGDMNILDTFAAATEFEPSKHPYILSWLYVPVHLVPRALWSGKPEKGILQDVSFMYGAPYSPGIAGLFLLDGGFLWMLGCMFVLGYLLCFFDGFLLTMPNSYLRCCLIGIFVINAMFLSRFFLWQWFYQVLYAAAPCIFLSWFLNRQPLSQLFGGFRRPSAEALLDNESEDDGTVRE